MRSPTIYAAGCAIRLVAWGLEKRPNYYRQEFVDGAVFLLDRIGGMATDYGREEPE
jgi:hypothetical protein